MSYTTTTTTTTMSSTIPSSSSLLTSSLFFFFFITLTTATTPTSSFFPSAATPASLPECVSAAGIPRHDTRAINLLLSSLVTNSTFFSVFSVALDKPCPFWRDPDHLCVIRDCSVHECDDTEIPSTWRSSPCPNPSSSSSPVPTPSDHAHPVDRSLTGLAALIGPAPCMATDNTAWVSRDDHDDSVFVDLRRNPERYTGYSGNDARRVWNAIYSENCFTFSQKCSSGICLPDTCKEERVLYRLISGLHTSITMHIAKEYLYPSQTFASWWGKNPTIYRMRIQPFPERLANLHVVYAVVLRAVVKAIPVLSSPQHFQYTTGNEENDLLTRELLGKLFGYDYINDASKEGCDHDSQVHKIFDESDMFLQEQRHLLPEFRNAFRNISMIMDCVGCEKCRLWGKLQFLGLGTALRILFEPELPRNLERNDVIALFNLLNKLSTSVLLIDEMETLIKMRRDAQLKMVALALSCLLFLVVTAVRRRKSSAKCKGQKKKKTTTTTTTSQCSTVNSGTSSTTTSIVKSDSATAVQNADADVDVEVQVEESNGESMTMTTPTGSKRQMGNDDDDDHHHHTPKSDNTGSENGTNHNGNDSSMDSPKTPVTAIKRRIDPNGDAQPTPTPRRSERLRKRSVAKAD